MTKEGSAFYQASPCPLKNYSYSMSKITTDVNDILSQPYLPKMMSGQEPTRGLEENTRIPRRSVCSPWQYLLVFEMIGLEANLGLETIFIIANFQTLGIPIRYSSIPGVVSAAVGVVLIPSLGLLMNKRGNTSVAKAKILVYTTLLVLIGNFLLFFANVIKLLYYDDNDFVENFWMLNKESQIEASFRYSHGYKTQDRDNFIINSSLQSNRTSNATGISERFFDNDKFGPVVKSEENIRFYALMAMVGFVFIDCGYDSCSCYLKTFALDRVSSQDQTGIIVKSIWISSFGGCLIALLGSLDLGHFLTAGTSHDKNAAQCAFIAALCFVLTSGGLMITLITGFCCQQSLGSPIEEKLIATTPTDEEKVNLITYQNRPHDTPLLQPSRLTSDDEDDNSIQNSSICLLGSSTGTRRTEAVTDRDRNKILRFIIRYKKLILLNVSTFCLTGANYSSSVYSANFVGQAIFHGDPQAAVNSPENDRYIDGLRAGSVGTLIWYCSFTLFSAIQAKVLAKVGWKTHMAVVVSVQIVLSLITAASTNIWAFYVSTVWKGISKATVFTVPYILANQFAKEQTGKNNTSISIVITSSMLPSGFIMCAAIVGPLIDLTSNSAVHLYYTAINLSVGLLVMCCIHSNDEK